MILLGRTQMVENAPTYEEAVARLMALGFDGVEIDLYDKQFVMRKDFFADGFPQKVREYVKKYKIGYVSVGAHGDYTADEKTVLQYERAVQITSDLGAKVMIINSAERPAEETEETFRRQWDAHLQALQRICSKAETCHVTIAEEFEPQLFLRNTDMVLQMMRELDSPAFRINADIGHMFLADPDPVGMIGKIGPLIVHAHLENMAEGVHDHLVPWEGDMDLQSYLEALKKAGFDGPASLDLYHYHYEEVAPKSLRYLRELLDRISFQKEI